MAHSRNTSREKLLRVSAALFMKKGYTATSIRDIAAALDLESASLYYYMKTKEELLYEISKDSLENLISATEGIPQLSVGPGAKLEQLIKTHVSTLLRDQDEHAVMLTEWKALSAKNRKRILALRDRYQDLVEAILSEGQQAGVLRADISAQLLRVALLSMLNWIMFWYKPEGVLTPEAVADVMKHVFLEGTLLGTEATSPSAESAALVSDAP